MKYLSETTLIHANGVSYVTETPTLWICTHVVRNHALPCAIDWRYRKREHKTLKDAVNAFRKDVKKYEGRDISEAFTISKKVLL